MGGCVGVVGISTGVLWQRWTILRTPCESLVSAYCNRVVARFHGTGTLSGGNPHRTVCEHTVSFFLHRGVPANTTPTPTNEAGCGAGVAGPVRSP